MGRHHADCRAAWLYSKHRNEGRVPAMLRLELHLLTSETSRGKAAALEAFPELADSTLRITIKLCKWCGKAFIPDRNGQQFDSKTCCTTYRRKNPELEFKG